MTRISKTLAQNVASKLVEKKRTELGKMRIELSEYIHDWYVTKIPKDVMKLFKAQKKWFSTRGSISFCGNGFNYKSFGFRTELPTGGDYNIMPDETCAKEVTLMVNAIEKKEDEIDRLHSEIKHALIGLKNYSNIEKEFPEAYKLLPKENQCTAIMVNVDKIRERL